MAHFLPVLLNSHLGFLVVVVVVAVVNPTKKDTGAVWI